MKLYRNMIQAENALAGAIASLEVARTGMLASARTCDRWARESRDSGWSTHQALADMLRADADLITQTLEKL